MRRVLILLFVCKSIFSSGQTAFVKKYKFQSTVFGIRGCKAINNGMIITYQLSYDTCVCAKYFVMRCNEIGDSLWTKPINYNNRYIYSSNDGGYFSSYLDNMTKFDSSMNVEWDFTMYMLMDNIYDISQAPDSSYFILGAKDTIFTGVPSIKHIYKLDKNGNQLWEKYYYGNYYLSKIQSTTDNGAIIYGSIKDSISNTNLMLMKIDNNGDSLWNKEYYNYHLHTSNISKPIITYPNGDFSFLAGKSIYSYLIKTDSLGVIISMDSLQGNSAFTENINSGFDGSICGIGVDNNNSNNRNIQLIFRQYNPDNFSQYQIGDLTDEEGLFIYQTSDSGYYMIANRDSSGQREILLLKNTPGHNFFYSVNEITSHLSATINPNPTTGHLTINLDDRTTNIEIAISNTFGQEVSRTTYSNRSHLELEIKGESGLYFVRVVAGQKSGVYKIVKM